MSTIIEFSDSDLLRNKHVTPGWYLLQIDGHRTWSPSKAGDSDNCFFECTIEKNADNGDTEFQGVPIELMFNSKPKAKGFLEGFLRGMGVDVTSKTRYDLQSAVGKKIEAFIEDSEYNGRITSKVNHKYRVVRS